MNHYLPIILPSIATPAAAYFIRMYLKNLSIHEISEAARIDGASEFKIFNIIILPVLKPVLALQLIFSFTAAWNNDYIQTLLLMDWDKKTSATYLNSIAGGYGAGLDPVTYAAILAVTLPSIIVYILCSKSVISSITLGSVKE